MMKTFHALRRSRIMTAPIAMLLLVSAAAPVTDEPIEILSVRHDGRNAVRIGDRAGLVRVDRLVPVSDESFQDGVVEGYLTGAPSPGSSSSARGFVGIAFRIESQPKRYDVIYIRMTNGRAADQLRRNRTLQYEHEPDFPWDRLRAEAPGKYESYADVAANQWIRFRIEVSGSKARLFLDDNPQPSLIVDDLRSGTNGSGAVALFIGPETIGYFSDVRVTPSRR